MLLTLAATAWTVASAQAQWVVTPYLGHQPRGRTVTAAPRVLSRVTVPLRVPDQRRLTRRCVVLTITGWGLTTIERTSSPSSTITVRSSITMPLPGSNQVIAEQSAFTW